MTMTLTVDHRAVDGAAGGGLPADGQAVRGRAGARPVTTRRASGISCATSIAVAISTSALLGFDETFVDWDDKWSRLEHGSMRIALAEGEPAEGGVAMVDVDDVKGAADKVREKASRWASCSSSRADAARRCVRPDGNRVQLAQQIGDSDP